MGFQLFFVHVRSAEFHCDLQLYDRSRNVNGTKSVAGGWVADGIPLWFATARSFPQCVEGFNCSVWTSWSVKCEVWSVKFEVWSAKSAVWSVECGVWRLCFVSRWKKSRLSREGHGRDRLSSNYRSFIFGKLPPPACPGTCTFNKSDNPLSVESYQFQEFQTSETARKVSPVSSPLGASSLAQPSQFRDTWRVKSDTVLPDVKTIEGVLCRRGMAWWWEIWRWRQAWPSRKSSATVCRIFWTLFLNI